MSVHAVGSEKPRSLPHARGWVTEHDEFHWLKVDARRIPRVTRREVGVVEIVGIARNIARGQIGAQAFKRDDFASADPRQHTARVLRTTPAKRDEKRHHAAVNALCRRFRARIARD